MIDQGLISNDGVAAQLGVDSIQETGASGYGARLKAQREQAGLSVTDVAATLRLHPNQVRAIEQEDLSRLPALAYVRGFIRSYARVLRLDPEPLLSDLNAKLAPTGKSVVDGMATDIAAAHAAGRERLFPQWAIGIALVIVITLGVIGWQTTLRQATAPSQMAAVPAAASPIPSTPAPAPMAPVVVPATTAPVATSEPASAPAAGIEPVPTPADTAEPTVASSRMASGAPPTVLLRFNGNSWAEVTDRNGKILLSQLNSAGAEHALDGELPLTVVIGDANFASAEVRGAAFNMQPFIRNNVARFTIK
jgi:cytoskeleton protein RodZ